MTRLRAYDRRHETDHSPVRVGAARHRRWLRAGTSSPREPTSGSGATNTDAATFLAEANATTLRLSNEANQAGWVQNTFITPDTEAMAARANEALITAVTRYAKRRPQLRRRRGAARRAPPAERAEERADDGGAGGSQGDRRADAARRVDGGRVRARQVLRRRRIGRGLPRHRGDHRDPGQGPQSRARARSVGGVAHHLAADEEELRAVRRAVEQGRAGARIRRHRRDVAVEVRHAARRVREGARPAVGAAAAALPVAAHLRPREAARNVRRRRAGRRARFPRICSATSGRRTGRTSTTSSAPPAARG